jgi:hypothetical protein
MKIFLVQKYRYVKEKLSKKQTIMNFIAEHPRLTAIVAGLGISFAFASIGRFAIHEAFALSVASPFNDAVYNVPSDHLTSFSSGSLPQDAHYHKVAVFSTTCSTCAKEFAPGNEAIFPGNAKDFAPSELAKSPGDASNFAPGHLKK